MRVRIVRMPDQHSDKFGTFVICLSPYDIEDESHSSVMQIMESNHLNQFQSTPRRQPDHFQFSFLQIKANRMS
jgi:ADP-glucose pyrophosphorylase